MKFENHKLKVSGEVKVGTELCVFAAPEDGEAVVDVRVEDVYENTAFVVQLDEYEDKNYPKRFWITLDRIYRLYI
jgi:acyl CoA:acetate/3-ketoacid CoA transferase beta subunit